MTPTRHGERACHRCRHYRIQHHRAWCIHPAYRLPVPWLEAIATGQPCGGESAPLFEPLNRET